MRNRVSFPLRHLLGWSSLVAVLAVGCGAAARTVARPAAPRSIGAAPSVLRFPLPDWTRCSRGFRPAERHHALDIMAPPGTPVRASAGGVVVRATRHDDYGLMVVLEHPGPNGFYTLYAHLSRLDVAVGDRVVAGRRIGAVGSSGNATGPHLHWEVLRAPARLPVRAEGALGIAGGEYRIDPAAVVSGAPSSCR